MRRAAVVISILAGITFGAGCTARLLLPDSVQTDSGVSGNMPGPSAGDGEIGAAGTNGSSGGAGRSGGGIGGAGGQGGVGQGGRGGGTAGADGQVVCGDRVGLSFTRRKAKFLIALGRNASMATPYGNNPATTRMSAVQQALHSLVLANQTAINFAYEDFPKCPGGSTCCSDSVDYLFTGSTFAAIDTALHQCDNGPSMYGCVSQSEARPIGQALQNAASNIFMSSNMSNNDNADRYLILLIDGPATCMSNNVDPCIDARQGISELMILDPRVSTYVVPIGQDAELDSCVRDMAKQGEQGASGNPNYPFVNLARDPMQLALSLNQIATRAAAAVCRINLQTTPPDPGKVALFLQGQLVPRLDAANAQDGWNFVPPGSQTIQVHGSYCAMIRMGQNDIRVCP